MTLIEPDWFIGTDIVSVPRISEILKKESDSFTARIFTEEEITYCSSRNNPAIHFAGRFAAKEAVKKAILSHDPKAVVPLKSISISRSDSGDPIVVCNGFLECKVSISHTEEFAIAFAVAMNK